MHSGENYRRIQEERELIDRALPTQHNGKVRPGRRPIHTLPLSHIAPWRTQNIFISSPESHQKEGGRRESTVGSLA